MTLFTKRQEVLFAQFKEEGFAKADQWEWTAFAWCAEIPPCRLPFRCPFSLIQWEAFPFSVEISTLAVLIVISPLTQINIKGVPCRRVGLVQHAGLTTGTLAASTTYSTEHGY